MTKLSIVIIPLFLPSNTASTDQAALAFLPCPFLALASPTHAAYFPTVLQPCIYTFVFVPPPATSLHAFAVAFPHGTTLTSFHASGLNPGLHPFVKAGRGQGSSGMALAPTWLHHPGRREVTYD